MCSTTSRSILKQLLDDSISISSLSARVPTVILVLQKFHLCFYNLLV